MWSINLDKVGSNKPMRFLKSHRFSGRAAAIVGLFLFVFLPFKIGKTDCGIGVRTHENYSLVHLDLFAWQSDYAPYLMGYQVIGDIYALQSRQRDAQRDDNIGEWRDRFCDIPDSSDIEKLLYKATLDELAELRDAAAMRRRDVYFQLEYNSFAQVLKQNGCKETIDYLIFAKRCEPFCLKKTDWKADQPRDVADMQHWISIGKQQFLATKSHFLRLRYLYQMVRLAHYAHDYAAVLQIWDEFLPKMQRIQSIINYWALAHRAGALHALGRRAEAAYLFAVVFRYCPSKRRQAFESFDIKTEAEFQQCLGFCKTSTERAAIYAVRASRDNAKALEDMLEIYKLDPKNEHLDMLLIRETLRLEKILLGADFRRQRYDAATMQKTLNYAARLTEFVRAVADQNVVRKPALWRTTEGYLRLLNGDVRGALVTLLRAKQAAAGDQMLIEQIENYTLAAKIVGLQIIDIQSDSTISLLRSSNAFASDPDFDGLIKEKMGVLFQARGDFGAAYLSNGSIGEMQENPSLELIENLIRFCQKPNKTLLEKELTTTGNRTIEADLWDLKGRYFLMRFQLEAAAQAFENVPANLRFKQFSPFSDRIRDCVNCPSSDTSGLTDRLSFTKTMLDLEFNARALGNAPQAAPYNYKLALGYYNMTFFGNSSGLADAHRSGLTWQRINQGRNVFPVKNNLFGNVELLDCSVARTYFEKTRQLADNSDRELAARAAFWVAKCDQNLFFISTENRYRTGSKLIPDLPPQYRQHFDLLKNYYAATNFYKQAQSECKYFRFYTAR